MGGLMTDRMLTRDAEEIGGISPLRFSVCHDRPPKVDGAYVVYWMTAARRKVELCAAACGRLGQGIETAACDH